MSAILIKLCYNYIRCRKKDFILAKVFIKSTLKNDDDIHMIETKGILKNDLLIYNDDSLTVHVCLSSPIMITRENDEYKIILKFDQNKIITGNYLLKEINSYIPIEIKTNKLQRKDEHLKINYELSIDGNWRKYELLIDYRRV